MASPWIGEVFFLPLTMPPRSPLPPDSDMLLCQLPFIHRTNRPGSRSHKLPFLGFPFLCSVGASPTFSLRYFSDCPSETHRLLTHAWGFFCPDVFLQTCRDFPILLSPFYAVPCSIVVRRLCVLSSPVLLVRVIPFFGQTTAPMPVFFPSTCQVFVVMPYFSDLAPHCESCCMLWREAAFFFS